MNILVQGRRHQILIGGAGHTGHTLILYGPHYQQKRTFGDFWPKIFFSLKLCVWNSEPQKNIIRLHLRLQW